MGGPSSQLGGKQDEEVEANFEAVDIPGAYYASAAAAPPFLTQTACRNTCEHGGEVATKVGYFGVKSANVGLGPDGHQTC